MEEGFDEILMEEAQEAWHFTMKLIEHKDQVTKHDIDRFFFNLESGMMKYFNDLTKEIIERNITDELIDSWVDAIEDKRTQEDIDDTERHYQADIKYDQMIDDRLQGID